MQLVAKAIAGASIAFLLTTPLHGAPNNSQFVRVQPAPDLSLEVPKHWAVLTEDDSKNLATLAESVRRDSGIPKPDHDKSRLLAINSTPSPPGALIRVNLISPDALTQEALLAATPSELTTVAGEVHRNMKALEAKGGPVVTAMDQARIETVGAHKALVLSYERKGFGRDPTPWRVTQYGVPMRGKTFQITLSYRIRDGVIWKPILERVKNSIAIGKGTTGKI